MASKGAIDSLKKPIEQFQSIDEAKILRPNLGDASLESTFGSIYSDLKRKFKLLIEYAPKVSNNRVTNASNLVNAVRTQINRQAELTDEKYVAEKQRFLQNIETAYENFLLDICPFFIIARVEITGILEDENVREEQKLLVEELKKVSSDTINKAKVTSNEIIEQAKQLSKEIEAKSRRTATGISLEVAQKQFKEAQDQHKQQVILWSILSVATIGAFLIIAYFFFKVQFEVEFSG